MCSYSVSRLRVMEFSLSGCSSAVRPERTLSLSKGKSKAAPEPCASTPPLPRLRSARTGNPVLLPTENRYKQNLTRLNRPAGRRQANDL
jgi:hypothetical protein